MNRAEHELHTLIDAAEDALYSRGDALQCLELCTKLLERVEEEPDFVDVLLIKASAELSLDRLDDARATASELSACVIDDPLACSDAGRILLDVGDDNGAEEWFRAALRGDPDIADAYHGLGMVCEARGDKDGMVVCWLRTLELDAAAPRPDWHLGDDELAAIAEAALAELPDEVVQRLENLPILIDELPHPDVVREGLDPRLLGLFSGVPLPHKSHITEQPPAVDSVHLYRRNLERACTGPEDLAEQIRITVLHETAHYFGLEDDDLDDLGRAC